MHYVTARPGRPRCMKSKTRNGAGLTNLVFDHFHSPLLLARMNSLGKFEPINELSRCVARLQHTPKGEWRSMIGKVLPYDPMSMSSKFIVLYSTICILVIIIIIIAFLSQAVFAPFEKARAQQIPREFHSTGSENCRSLNIMRLMPHYSMYLRALQCPINRDILDILL